MTTVRTYTKRDSATAVLKKAGFDKSVYAEYIIVEADGTFTLEQGEDGAFLPVARDAVTDGVTTEEPNGVDAIVKAALARNAADGERLKNATTVSKSHTLADDEEEAKPVKKAIAKKLAAVVKKTLKGKNVPGEIADKPETVSSVMRAMILDGKTNQEVWDECKDRFNLDDKKRGYPAWYRTELKNKGLLPR